MKYLRLIIHTDFQDEICHALRESKQINGFTLFSVDGHGIEADEDSFLSAREKELGFVSRTRIDILLEDKVIDDVLNHLRQQVPDIKDKGIYWVTHVEQKGRL